MGGKTLKQKQYASPQQPLGCQNDNRAIKAKTKIECYIAENWAEDDETKIGGKMPK